MTFGFNIQTVVESWRIVKSTSIPQYCRSWDWQTVLKTVVKGVIYYQENTYHVGLEYRQQYCGGEW